MGSGDRQHYLPAALIGGFGDRRGRRDPREALVCWRRRSSPVVRETIAEAIGWRRGTYRLEDPQPGVDPDIVDAVWDDVEGELSSAVGRFETRADTQADHDWLRAYAGTAGVRHPQFASAVNRWLPTLDLPPVSGDQVHVARLVALRNSREIIRSWRWRLLHSPQDAPRFAISDLGWAYIGQPDMNGRGLYLPLNSRVAALAWRGTPGGFDHQLLRPNWVRWLNAAMWTEAPEFLVTHPDEHPSLEVQRTADEVAARVTLSRGAFQELGGPRLLFDET